MEEQQETDIANLSMTTTTKHQTITDNRKYNDQQGLAKYEN